MLIVSCASCADILGRPVASEYPDDDRAEAESFVSRHHALVDHHAEIKEAS